MRVRARQCMRVRGFHPFSTWKFRSFSLDKAAARADMDAALHRTALRLSPRLPERGEAATAQPTGHGLRNLFHRLVVSLVSFFHLGV